mmetsp:Transcript_56663/g.137712  ORF Transcript_56663/g.137712 Transcript_56663/m.137712 type:complete len:266 (-) Transcript_56663:1327-2124(-)
MKFVEKQSMFSRFCVHCSGTTVASASFFLALLLARSTFLVIPRTISSPPPPPHLDITIPYTWHKVFKNLRVNGYVRPETEVSLETVAGTANRPDPIANFRDTSVALISSPPDSLLLVDAFFSSSFLSMLETPCVSLRAHALEFQNRLFLSTLASFAAKDAALLDPTACRSFSSFRSLSCFFPRTISVFVKRSSSVIEAWKRRRTHALSATICLQCSRMTGDITTGVWYPFESVIHSTTDSLLENVLRGTASTIVPMNLKNVDAAS